MDKRVYLLYALVMPIYPPLNDRPSYLLMRFALQCRDIEARIRNYGTDVQVHEAEIHMIKAIQQTGPCHISGLAKKLEVTKGNVSQIIMKLEKKGLVSKIPDEENHSRLTITLTPKGKTAYARHEEIHLRFDAMTEQELGKYPPEFRTSFASLMKNLLSGMDEWEE